MEEEIFMGTDHRPVRAAVSGRRLTTVLITRNAYDWQYGGAEQFCLNFAKALRAEGIRPVVMTRVPELLRQCRAEGIDCLANLWLKNETHRRWMLAYYALYPVLVAQYAYVMVRYRVSAALLGSRDDQIFGTMAARLLGRPVAWVDHADMKGIIAQPFRFLRRSYFWAMARARRIVAVSVAEREKIFANLPERYQTRFAVINNGAALAEAEPMVRPKRGRVVVFVGRLERDKGVYDLAAAMPEVLAKHPDTQFWLAGKGRAEADVRRLVAEAGIGDNVRLLGHLDRVGEALLAADVFVYPTHHDASPLAPVEAMQAGLPVVANRVGGVPEVVRDGQEGLLVEPERPEELAAAISRVLGDKALYERLAAGARQQGERLRFDRVVRERYIPLLEEMMK
jgi:glycosyltransferase involved in cell wall biosynthesis